MKKQSKTPQPQKANEKSFKPGNKDSEKWTYDVAKSFFEQALEVAESKRTLMDIALELKVYSSTFDYIVKKYPDLECYKKEILEILKNNLINKAMDTEISVPMAIFVLKNNHGMSDKQEIDQRSTNINYNAELTPEEIKRINLELENEC